jgi:hypothetical protein
LQIKIPPKWRCFLPMQAQKACENRFKFVKKNLEKAGSSIIGE